jgi:surface protein
MRGVQVASTATVQAAECEDFGAFITRWDTRKTGYRSSSENQIRLPLEPGETYDFVVEWGDGTSETITSGARGLHTYAVAGEYTVRITGTLIGWCFFDGDQLKLLDVVQWGSMRLGNSGHYFHGAENLVISAKDAPDLRGTTDMSGMFKEAKSFNSPIGHWDVSQVTNMRGMFQDAHAFNQDIGGWNVSNVTDMGYMFCSAKSFNQDISGWDVSHVTNMRGMFSYARAYNQDMRRWNVSNVTDMAIMFNEASSFHQDISGWDVSRVTSGAGNFCWNPSRWFTEAKQPRWGLRR